MAYVDMSGRFFLLAFALDTHTGNPADNSDTVNVRVESGLDFPSSPIPGVFKKDYE